MLISDVKKYIQLKQSVTITDLAMYFDMDREELRMPLDMLCSSGYITQDKPIADIGQPTKCSGCPMGCKPKAQETCSPAPSFIIYNWVKK